MIVNFRPLKLSSFKNPALIMASIALGLTILASPKALAENPNVSKSPLPGATWTKVEDLDPNKKSSNRPIKRKWAVVVGMSKFKERRLQSDDLKNSKAAREFHKFLTDPNGGRFSTKQCRLLINLKATKENVLSTIGSSWLGQLAGEDDLVVVFISTSSFPTTDGGAYLCAYDCALDNVYGTCISMKDLMSTLKKNVKAKRIVLIIQAGYSGAASLSDGAKSLDQKMNFDPSKFVSGSGYILLSSSKPNQMSWGNIFSKNLIASLKLNDGLIPIDKAFNKAKKQTELDTTTYAKRYYSKQTPVLQSDWKGKDLSIGTPALETLDDLPANISEFLAAEAYYFRANSLLSQGKVDEAIGEYKRAIQTDPKYVSAIADYATVLALKGKWQESEKLFERAINEKPDNALYRVNYARVLSKLRKKDASLAQLEKAYELNPKDREVLTALSSQMLRKNDPNTAVNLLAQAIKLYPKSSKLHNRMSYALARSGDLNNALIHANKAVRLNPKSATAQINLGSTLMLDGSFSKAQSAYEKAISIEPKNATAHLLLSKSYAKAGNKQKEKEALRKFVELASPKDPRAVQAQIKLGRP